MSNEIKVVGIVGAGQMGNGIAQVAAASGFQVIIQDISSEALTKGMTTIQTSLDRLIKKGTFTETQKGEVLARIKTTTEIQSFKSCDIVIEAATENVELKLKIFKQVDEILAPHALLVSNTSSISITKMAASTRRPDKVAGMHFMNPVPLMKLVEGIRGLQTSDETFSMIRKMSEKMGKVFVESAKDMPGFLVNRILMPMINEAMFVLYEGIGTPEAIDEAMKLGTNQPMGPLTLADFVGLDTCLSILNVLYDGFGDPKYRPCPLLIKYVEAGWLGKKSGRGFYQYQK